MSASGMAAVMLLASAGAGPDSSAGARDGGSLAVICLGPEVEATGSLQDALESALAAVPQLQVQPTAEIAKAMGGQDITAAPDPAARVRAEELLAEAKRAFYDDALPASLDRLGALAALQEQSERTTTADRVHVLLWRTNVFLSLNDTAAAEREAAAALAIAPDLKVDPAVFPPSIRDFVDKLRGRGLRTVAVEIRGLPERAAVFVDDRSVGRRFRIPPGRHRLAVAAPGHRGTNRAFDVSRDTAITVHLPLAVPPRVEEVLLGAVWQGATAPATRPRLEELAERLGVDGLVIAAIRGEPAQGRAFVWWKEEPEGGTASPVMAATPAASSGLGSWVAARAREDRLARVAPLAIAPAAAGTPNPALPPAAAASRPLTRRPLFWGAVGTGLLALSVGAALAASPRQRDPQGVDATEIGRW